tara:strand:+ start:496 stop:750 length:255 start_codon:yes stop_codon:yes gene_type:complete
MSTIANYTVLKSNDNNVAINRCEFKDDTEYTELVLFCDDLNLKQNTETFDNDGGSRKAFKVKTITASDDKGNHISLKIFFNTEA